MMCSQISAVVIGAGLTGRGFIGRMLHQQNVSFSLIDHDKELVDELRNGYTVQFFSSRSPVHIKPVAVIHTEDSSAAVLCSKADLLFVSVGKRNVSDVASYLKMMPVKDNAVICVCENMECAAQSFHSQYDNKEAIVTEGIIFCTTTSSTDKMIISEDYDLLPYNAKLAGDNAVKRLSECLHFMQPVILFRELMIRKLFTYNAATAVISFLGFIKGYKYLYEAALDPEISVKLHSYYCDIGEALCKAYGYDREDQEKFAQASYTKFSNSFIRDPVSRNIRNPLEKLMPGERLIGPLRILSEYGISSPTLYETIAAALVYSEHQPPFESAEIRLEYICQILQNEVHFTEITKYIGLIRELYAKKGVNHG